MYSFEAIKDAADCLDYATNVLHLQPVKPGRFSVPWRADSTGDGFAINARGWHDFTDGSSGSILDLVARINHNGDVFAASDELGAYYQLPDNTGIVKASKAKAKARIAATYDYLDPNGNIRFQVVRMDPKSFRQRRPDGNDWIWDMQGVERVLYRLPEIMASAGAVHICEGEKDADNVAALGVVATTTPGGAAKWLEQYRAPLANRPVVLFRDNDSAGAKHVTAIAASLHNHASTIHIVSIPGDKGADVSDWIAGYKGGLELGFNTAPIAEAFAELCANGKEYAAGAPAAAATAITASPTAPTPTVSTAKQANLEPLSNYVTIDIASDSGKTKQERQPRHINEIVTDIHQRFLGFPGRIGYRLFDHDRDSGEIRNFDEQSELFSWIQEKSGQAVRWQRFEGCVSRQEMLSALLSQGRVYQSISAVPSYPLRDDVYYTFGELPAATDRYEYFEQFCDFFSPATAVDRELIRVFVASCLYYRREADCPLWIINSTTGQDSGKTTLVEMVAVLLGGDDIENQAPLSFSIAEFNSDHSHGEFTKRALSKTGRCKRIGLADNESGRVASRQLASMTTAASISGRPAFGRGEETRPNDITYVITTNDAAIDSDLASRAFFIYVKRAKRDTEWTSKFHAFIHQYRLRIIADCIAQIESQHVITIPASTRFSTWERDILRPILHDDDTISDVVKLNIERATGANQEVEEADDIRTHFIKKLSDIGLDPEKQCAWIPSKIATDWAKEAVEPWRSLRSTVVIAKLRNFAKIGQVPELSAEWESYPHRGSNRTRGIRWLHTDEHTPVLLLKKSADGGVKSDFSF